MLAQNKQTVRYHATNAPNSPSGRRLVAPSGGEQRGKLQKRMPGGDGQTIHGLQREGMHPTALCVDRKTIIKQLHVPDGVPSML